MQSSDGTILEVFEWLSQASVDAAHSNPRVQEMWNTFEEICEFVPVSQVAEASQLFPGFEAIASS